MATDYQFKVVVSFSFIRDDKRVEVDEEFNFTKAEQAITFAQGYKEAVMWYVQIESPCCPQIDGYHWWDIDGRDMIAVYNKDHMYVTSADFKI